MKAALSLLALTLWLAPFSKADYSIPGMSVALKSITDILDVRVTEMNEKGEAGIEVLNAYKGGNQAAKAITGTYLSCTGGTPKMFGMKPGQRYIVLLIGSDLYEESSFFEVKTEKGVSKCKLNWYGDKTWFDTQEEWISLRELKAKIGIAMKVPLPAER